MSEIPQLFDDYGDFNEKTYFYFLYRCIPSELSVNLPLEANSTNMNQSLNLLQEKLAIELEQVYKEWHTSSNKNEAPDKDFPMEHFFRGTNKSLTVKLLLSTENLSVSFLYDHSDAETEQRIIFAYQYLRNQFGKKKSPIFKVLSKGSGDFYTEEINIENFQIDINQLYNDDFKEINQIIDESLRVDRSGLVLLHGAPGTGKTSYIKSLLTTHQDKNFIFVPNDFVHGLLNPDFISFLIAHKNSILVIEDAEKVITSRELENRDSVVSTILQLTDGLFSDYLNIKIICTFNTSINKIDKALLRKGRMIAFYEFKALDAQKADAILESKQITPPHQPMTLAEVFNYSSKDFDKNAKRQIGFGVK